MKLFHLQIITPEKTFFDEDVQMVVVKATDGEVGILADHEPTVISLVEDAIRIQYPDGHWRNAATSKGFVTINREEVLVLFQTIEWPEDIDMVHAQRNKELAEERLRQHQSMNEYYLSRAMLARAMVRLRVGSNKEIN